MVVRGLYLKDFEPICQPHEYIQTFPKTKYYYQVLAVYGLPLLEVDLADSAHLNASVTTTESSEVEVDDIYLDDLELGHFRVIPRDDFAITHIAKPKARSYLTTKNKVWQIQTILDDPRSNPAVENLQLQELFQFEDTEMWVKVKSNSATLTNARLEFFGYRLILEEVKQKDIPSGIKPTRLPTEGWSGTEK